MITNYRKFFILKLIVLFLLLQISSSFVNPYYDLFAQTDQSCADILEKAEDAYYDGEYDQAIQLTSKCLKQPDITVEQKSHVYTILSRTFIAMNQIEKAEEYINENLDINPDYLPTIEQETPAYVNLVIQERKKREEVVKVVEAAGISSWVWIGAGGVLATAAIIVIASSGSNDDEPKDKPLPEPPVFP